MTFAEFLKKEGVKLPNHHCMEEMHYHEMWWDSLTAAEKRAEKEKDKKYYNEMAETEKAELKKLKIIFTKEDKKTARKKIGGFRQSYIIDARELVLEFDYEPGQEVSSPHEFIINKELEKRMQQALVNKKSQQIIYFHYDINPDLIRNVKGFFKNAKTAKVDFFLYDPRGEFKKMKRMFTGILT